MSTRSPLNGPINQYHIMCTVTKLDPQTGCFTRSPALLRIDAVNRADALTIASQKGTSLIVLFATRAEVNY
jgi:hypothetical protein